MQTGFPSDSPTFRERVRIRPSPETESKGLPSLISQKLTKRCLSYVSPRYKSACCGLARQIFHRELRGRAAESAHTAAIEQAFEGRGRALVNRKCSMEVESVAVQAQRCLI